MTATVQNVNTKIRFQIEAAIPTASGKCKFSCGRKYTKDSPVVPRQDSFALPSKGSNAEDYKQATEMVVKEILRRCGNEPDKFNLVCKAIKLDPKNAATIKVRQIHKLRFLLGE